MYRYDQFDVDFVRERTEQFRNQVARRLSGALSEEEFRPLRLMNGLYLQLHAYMLRVAIPYGVLSATQLRSLADIAERFDRGYGHFTTRQNIQFNWIRLADAPDVLAALAEVEMHAIQTSGNCIRNVTADPWAGAATDEVVDPRPYAEIIRQWSSIHPEYSFLPRKFKIAITGAAVDRTALAFHDIGLRAKRNPAGELGFEVLVGGGMGRTPILAARLEDWLPEAELLPYLDAIMRVYNLQGRRDDKYKARIKILVQSLGVDAFRDLVEAERANGGTAEVELPAGELERIRRYFAPPAFAPAAAERELDDRRQRDPAFAEWLEVNTAEHRQPGYAIVNLSLKAPGAIPGDIDANQMRQVASLADRFAHGEIRATHQQNLVLPHVARHFLYPLYQGLVRAELATANIGLAGDLIACPGLDYCSLASTRSIPLAQALGRRFAAPDRRRAIGPLDIKISGCVNACGHHHAGHIGIRGVERDGAELFQLSVGGSASDQAAIGEILGRGLSSDEVGPTVDRIIDRYLRVRRERETFLETYRRLGIEPFREAAYAVD